MPGGIPQTTDRIVFREREGQRRTNNAPPRRWGSTGWRGDILPQPLSISTKKSEKERVTDVPLASCHPIRAPCVWLPPPALPLAGRLCLPRSSESRCKYHPTRHKQERSSDRRQSPVGTNQCSSSNLPGCARTRVVGLADRGGRPRDYSSRHCP